MKFILTKCLIMEETHDHKSQELNLYTKKHKKLTKLHFLWFQCTNVAPFISVKHCERILKEKPKRIRVSLNYQNLTANIIL